MAAVSEHAAVRTMHVMWMPHQFRNAVSRLRPASLASLGLLGGSLVGLPGCVQSPPARRMVTQPAPPLLEGRAGAQESPDATEWRDPRDDSVPRATEGTDAAAKAAAKAAKEAAMAAGAVSVTGAPSDAVLLAEVDQTMNDWHQAASAGDRERYLRHFAPDAVFHGPGATERWDLATFTSMVDDARTWGSGWTYAPSNRRVTLGGGSQIAWMDEELESDGFGALRGTGVLRREGDEWKIAYYSLVYTVPTSVRPEVVDVIGSALPPNRR